ncbi:MAG TPA: carboxypeptidase-like regulatory domain-containing protein [Longimicrobiaceae bacterium]|nr:carboxypeptidase-like regulatory domain-containing protein [Longimicrobiaceae bacterium]
MRSRYLLPALSALVVLFLAAGAQLRAQQATGTIDGTATLAEGGAPIPLSLVQLLPASGSDEPLRGTLTDARGEFRFEGVAAGRYRLRMDRVGFVSAPSEPFAVGAGQTVRRRLAAELTPVELEGISVSGNACYGLDRLDDAPDLAALWREAQKAVETRRRFQQQYRFAFDRRVEGTARLRFLRNQRILQDTTIVNHPDSALARQARRRGFGQQGRTSFLLRLPDELELLDDDFLRTHCLEGDTDDGRGGLALRFRPVRPRGGGELDIRGVIHIDPVSYVVRELEFEYLNGRRPSARGTLRYAEVRTPDGTIRLPAGGTISGDPAGMVGMVVQGFDGTYAMERYRGFERLRDDAPPS